MPYLVQAYAPCETEVSAKKNFSQMAEAMDHASKLWLSAQHALIEVYGPPSRTGRGIGDRMVLVRYGNPQLRQAVGHS